MTGRDIEQVQANPQTGSILLRHQSALVGQSSVNYLIPSQSCLLIILSLVCPLPRPQHDFPHLCQPPPTGRGLSLSSGKVLQDKVRGLR